MLEAGVLVAGGLLVTFSKCSWAVRMRMLSNPLFMDVMVLLLLLIIHWGTFSGVMAATIGAMFCSLTLSAGRWMFGYIEDGKYFPGFRDVSAHLVKTVGDIPPPYGTK